MSKSWAELQEGANNLNRERGVDSDGTPTAIIRGPIKLALLGCGIPSIIFCLGSLAVVLFR